VGSTLQNAAQDANRDLLDKRVWRFAVVMWSITGVIAVFASWPYAMVAVIWSTCLHLAALDG